MRHPAFFPAGIAFAASGTLFLLCTLTIPAAVAAEDAASAEPAGGALRQSSFGVLTDYFYWTETGMPWTKQRVFEVSQSFVLAWLDLLGGESHEIDGSH